MKQFHTKGRENSGTCACFPPAHEPSFGARPVPGRSGSDSLLVPEPSPSRRLHSDPLRAGTSRAPDAGEFRGARRDKSSGRSLLGERERVRASVSSKPIFGAGGSRYFRFQISDFGFQTQPPYVGCYAVLRGHGYGFREFFSSRTSTTVAMRTHRKPQ